VRRPLPTTTSQPFFDAAAAGRLSFPHCRGCGAWQSYPRPYCPVCLRDDVELVAVAGTGTVHAATVVHRAIVTAFTEQIPYVHALVDLDEGIRIVSMIIDCPPEVVRPGLPVVAVIDLPPDETDGPSTPLVLFRPLHPSAR
jgi:uncharacterized protein